MSAANEKHAFLELSEELFDWQETSIGRYAVWYMSWDDEAGDVPVFAISEFKPGAIVPPHHHDSDYASYVLRGSLTVTRRHHGAGDLRFVKAGTVYGPIAVGTEGATVLEFFSQSSGLMPRWAGSLGDQTAYWPSEFATPEEWLASERLTRRLRPTTQQSGRHDDNS